MSEAPPIGRNLKNGGPWCWQSKVARRKIREAFDSTHNVATALSVYDALTEIASDETSDTFKTTHAWIQRISGASVRTIQNHLKVFAELGLVRVETAKLRAPSTYTLLAFGNDCATSGNGNASNGNHCVAFGNDQFRAPLPTSEEREKKDRKKDQKNDCAEPPAAAVALAPEPESPTLLSFPITGQGAGATWAFSEAHANQLSEAFVGIDVIGEGRKAVAWIQANPTKRKTARGMPAFLHRWLSNAANRAGGSADARGSGPVPWQRKTHEADHEGAWGPETFGNAPPLPSPKETRKFGGPVPWQRKTHEIDHSNGF
jgi:hypothetical protein